MTGFLRALWRYFWPTPPPPSPPPKLTENPWREHSNWNKKQNDDLLKELYQLQPKTKQNLLILGPVGAGKSSFINSVVSIDRGHKYGMATAGDPAFIGSWTFNLAAYSGKKLLKGYRLFDCKGIEPSNEQGFVVDDLIFLIKGKIKEGYTFNQAKPISEKDEHYNGNPTLEDQMHCVIFVVSATSVRDGVPDHYVQKIKRLQLSLRNENIPRVMVLTKIDLLCDEVAKDVTKMFKSIKVRETVRKASDLFGLEKASIHPVMNYEGDYNILHGTNIPILLAVRQAMQYSADRVDYVEH